MGSTVLPATGHAGPVSRAKPWWELTYAAGILLLSGVVGVLAAWAYLLFGYTAGLPISPDRLGTVVICVMEAVCLALVLGRAWSTSDGDLIAELGLGPGRRLWLLALAIGGELALLGYNLATALRSPSCGLHLADVTPNIIAASRETPGWMTLFLIGLVVLAPLSEELLFRGWLWTALRRSWGAWPTALTTGALFWVMHAGYGWKNLLLVLPVAVVLTLVRQFTGSIRGTLVLHVLHDGGAVVLTLLLVRAC